jgi:8-amino-7-oxononanoate synthase
MTAIASATPDVFAKIRTSAQMQMLQVARQADILPYFRELDGAAGPVVRMEGADRIMLGSNNYLGLTTDRRVLAGARDALERYGSGLTGSRLLNGTVRLHRELEEELAGWLGTEDAIAYTTGHHANLGALSALVGSADTIVADSADHASIVDGALLSRAKLRRFRHNDMGRMHTALTAAAADGGGVLVVVDGVFSMEGDVAPLPAIVESAGMHGARVMVDEAHALGVLGSRGAGSCELFGVEDRIDVRMGTFSKALGSCGGFIAADREVTDFLRVTSRTFLFTAAGVPAAAGAALAAVRICRSAEGPALFARVADAARHLSEGLSDLGFEVVPPVALPGGERIFTPIVPVMIGDDATAAVLWKALYDAGVYVNVALHPAVPRGRALLRASVMATHDEATLNRALTRFAQVKAAFDR